LPAKRSATTTTRRTATGSRRPATSTRRTAAPRARVPSPAPSGDGQAKRRSSQPWLHQRGVQLQEFGTVRQFPIALSYDARMFSCQLLNQTLADSQILYALYKKHHWLMRGATFYQLHLLLDKHADEQLELIDMIAERIQTLGGVAVGDPRHVAEITSIPRPPDGAEEVPAMLSRLLEAHEMILTHAHDAAMRSAEMGDDGTNDLLVSDVIRTGEIQAWFLAEHLVDTPLVHT
jgi:starvation-inducible DNA-binding protein